MQYPGVHFCTVACRVCTTGHLIDRGSRLRARCREYFCRYLRAGLAKRLPVFYVYSGTSEADAAASSPMNTWVGCSGGGWAGKFWL
jgi:hypothetical protein